ncbi:peptide MFS transporter [Nocardiopsis sediminis]|uniref:Peptide MFS transporter n=1 Tax=Nocardiopsis sediminis TaxID=1778267 RepID=A0ABV8FS18_9ACTN
MSPRRTRAAGPLPAPAERTFLGHPRWFGTLFIVDMWERFSFYGLLAILYLYLVAPAAEGGMGMTTGDAAGLFGIYMSLVFMSALPGGWVADRILGARRATLYGGVLIAAGHACMAVPVPVSLYPGLGLIIAGSGLVKPSMAAMIGQMYRGRPERREAAFSVFYVSIQVSALFAPLATGYAAERIDWHLGFGIAAAGMALGLLHYVLGMRHLGDVGRHPADPLSPEEGRRALRRTLLWGGTPAAAATAAVATGLVGFDRVLMAVGLAVVCVPAAYYTSLLRRSGLAAAERTRLRAFVWMLIASAVFWMLYAQGPALLNLFALDSVRRSLLGFVVPASWFQSVQPLFLLLLAPVFAALWVRLGARMSAPAKFTGGLLLGGLSFALMALAATAAETGPVSPLWLLGVYLLIVCGELAIAPVGLSLAAEVAPTGRSGQILGLFWLFAAVGAAVGGQLARLAEAIPESGYHLVLAAAGLATAVALGAAARALGTRLAAGTAGGPDPDAPAARPDTRPAAAS